MQEQMQMGMTAQPATEMYKIFQSERENLELIKHEWELERVEQRLLSKVSSPSTSSSSSSIPPRERTKKVQ